MKKVRLRQPHLLKQHCIVPMKGGSAIHLQFVMGSLGGIAATRDEAREILGLQGSESVNF